MFYCAKYSNCVDAKQIKTLQKTILVQYFLDIRTVQQWIYLLLRYATWQPLLFSPHPLISTICVQKVRKFYIIANYVN